jgi:hypothetical protein
MRRLHSFLLLAACAASTLGWGQKPDAAKPTMVRLTDLPVLVDCAPVTQSPCMAASVTPVDAAGSPAPATLPSPAELAGAITLKSEGSAIHPFFATAGVGPDASQHSNVMLLVLDISGSMNQPSPGSTSRFAALKDAVGKFLDGMDEGTDRIAIVPFESHDVVSTIRSAVYATTKADARAQLNALPEPSGKNNTALYQAIFSGVDSLKSEITSLQASGNAASELRPHLIVMTDGKNEVMAGDDAQLLNGDLGLQQASAQVQASKLDVIGIGFGDRASIDVSAMQKLSKRFFYASDAAELLAALHSSRAAVSHQVQMLWLLPQSNRLALMGQDYKWTAELHMPDGRTLSSNPVQWISPATNAPTYERKALAPELQALIQVHPSADSGWTSVVIYSLLFVAASVVVLVLWFWVPRLIWGNRYANTLPQRSKRWSSERSGMTSAAGVQVRSSSLPAGFDTTIDSGAPIQRSASQTTQIQPRGEFSRTRLTFEEK